MAEWVNPDPIIPRCTRTSGGAKVPSLDASHYCAHLCPHAYGLPCVPPAGSAWHPSPGPMRRYHELRNALGLPATGETTALQERYLRWFAEGDDETVTVLASLIALKGSAPWKAG